MTPLILGFLIASFSIPGWSYSEFIGLGYTSCTVCHFNGAGGGAITDYGRALFATEIAARPFWNPKITDEKLGEQSGFLGATKLPWWIRPGIKTRSLWYQANPGSSQSMQRFVQMQTDANAALFFDKKQTHLVLLSVGYVPEPRGGPKSPEADRHIISHEYYYRYRVGAKSFLYFGFMDKVYGLRIPDHTAFSRKEVGVGQQDQAHGLTFHHQPDGYEYFINAFAGNLEQEAAFRPVGLSLMGEKDMREKVRLGSGVLLQKNDFVTQTRVEVHSRMGLTDGHSVLAELGYMNDKPADGTAVDRAYAYVQGLLRATRGVHLLSMGQYYKKELTESASDQFRWGFGVDYFPMQRVEWRTELINSRSIAPNGVGSTGWTVQTQLHLSL